MDDKVKIKIKKELLNKLLEVADESTARKITKPYSRSVFEEIKREQETPKEITQKTPLYDMSVMYVEAVNQQHNIKPSVKAATTEDIDLSGEQDIDGYPIKAGDRVLVKDQENPAENGIYVASKDNWSRSLDANSDAAVGSNMFTFVECGNNNKGSGWYNLAPPVIDLNKTPLKFHQFGEQKNNAGNVRTGIQMSSGDSRDVGTFYGTVEPGTF